MSITVQFLGILNEAAGRDHDEMDVSGSKESVLGAIVKKYPSVGNLSFITAINGRVSHGNATVREGDLVTLIPPAPGG